MNTIGETSTGESYETDAFGVIHQRFYEPKRYDAEYQRNYDRVPICYLRSMGSLRLGYMLRMIPMGEKPTVFDLGFGSGHFLLACAEAGINSFGYDPGQESLPDRRIHVHRPCDDLAPGAVPREASSDWTVLTMFDVIEHLPSYDWLRGARARHVVISVPWCHWAADDARFLAWRHRKPGEHVHHFDAAGLEQTMDSFGYEALTTVPSNLSPEDAIRRNPAQKEPNILTMAFRRVRAAVWLWLALLWLGAAPAQAELRFLGIRAIGTDIYLSIDADRPWILEWSPDLVRWRQIWRNPGPPPGGQQYFLGKDPGAAAHAHVRGFYRLREDTVTSPQAEHFPVSDPPCGIRRGPPAFE